MKKLFFISLLALMVPCKIWSQSILIDSVQVYASSNKVDSFCISIATNDQKFSRVSLFPSLDECGSIFMTFIFDGCGQGALTYFDTCIDMSSFPTERLYIFTAWDTTPGCPFPTIPLVTDTFRWDQCFPLVIESPKTDFQINVYPNPAKDLLLIVVPEQINLEAIELYSLNGKLVKRFNSLERALIISEINTGLYFLRLRTEKVVITKKVVIE